MIDLQETERIKALLEQNPEDFEKLIEETPLAICITDEQGHFVAVNNNYLRMYGYSREEMIGNSFLMVVKQQEKDHLQEQHDMFLTFKDEIMRNWEVVRKDGSFIKIFADAGYSTSIQDKPRKVTFVWPKDEAIQKLMQGTPKEENA